MIDQNHVILYQNDMGVFYCTMMSPTQIYLFENVINIYHNSKEEPMILEDDHKNKYTIVTRYELESHTWESISIELQLVHATSTHFHKMPARARPIVPPEK